jgi:hypothetical protein
VPAERPGSAAFARRPIQHGRHFGEAAVDDIERQWHSVHINRHAGKHFAEMGPRFFIADRSAAIAIDRGQHLLGYRDARRQVQLDFDAIGIDGYPRRLQVLVAACAE